MAFICLFISNLLEINGLTTARNRITARIDPLSVLWGLVNPWGISFKITDQKTTSRDNQEAQRSHKEASKPAQGKKVSFNDFFQENIGGIGVQTGEEGKSEVWGNWSPDNLNWSDFVTLGLLWGWKVQILERRNVFPNDYEVSWCRELLTSEGLPYITIFLTIFHRLMSYGKRF